MQEIFKYTSKAYATITTFCAIGFYKTRKPQILVPPTMLAFPLHYVYDLVYGDKVHRMRETADRLLIERPDKFLLHTENLLISREEYDEIFDRKAKMLKQ